MRRNDVILIAAIVAFAAFSYVLTCAFSSGGTSVTVTKNGSIFGTYPLNEDTTVTIGDDEYNVLVIEDGKAYISDADCPGRTCVNSSPIDESGGVIICVPNGVIVEVSGDEGEFDALSY